MHLARYTWYNLGLTEQINKAQDIHFRISWIFIQVSSLGSIKGSRYSEARDVLTLLSARDGQVCPMLSRDVQHTSIHYKRLF